MRLFRRLGATMRGGGGDMAIDTSVPEVRTKHLSRGHVVETEVRDQVFSESDIKLIEEGYARVGLVLKITVDSDIDD